MPIIRSSTRRSIAHTSTTLVRWSIPLLAAALLATSAHGAEREYQLDPVHSRIAFQVDHLGFSRPLGTFSGIEGTLFFDRDNPSQSRIEASIPVGRLDLGDEDWNERMQRRDFFDLERYPRVNFKSTSVEILPDDRFKVRGILALRDAEREVVLDVKLNRRGRHPLTFRSTLGFSATASLKRSEFGMTAWKSVVGDQVDLIIEVEARRGRQRNSSGAETDTDTNMEATPSESADDVETKKESPHAVAQ